MARLASWEHMLEEKETMVAEFKATIRFVEDEYLNQRAEKLLLKAKTQGMTPQERKEYQMLVLALESRKSAE